MLWPFRSVRRLSSHAASTGGSVWKRKHPSCGTAWMSRERSDVTVGNEDERDSCSDVSLLFIFRHCPLVFSNANCTNTSAAARESLQPCSPHVTITATLFASQKKKKKKVWSKKTEVTFFFWKRLNAFVWISGHIKETSGHTEKCKLNYRSTI